jgi:hypothetical protein
MTAIANERCKPISPTPVWLTLARGTDAVHWLKAESMRTKERTSTDAAKMQHSVHHIEMKAQFYTGVIAALATAVLFATIDPAATYEAESVMGDWRMIRTNNPNGGPDAIAMSHTPDMSRSDLDLAGMMLKCADHGQEVAIIVLKPFPPRAKPQVTVSALGKEWRFVASTLPPGAEVILPPATTTLLAGIWQTAHELAVQVEAQGQSVKGIISIEGLAAASAALTANCLAH